MNWILFALSGYDPDSDARKPRPKTDTDKKRTAKRTTDLPDDVTTNRITKKPEQYVREDSDTHTWQQVGNRTDFGQRSSNLLPEEAEYLENTKNYLVEKGRILKVLWASGMTAQEAANSFTERGYSYETVRRYWTLFNRFCTSPTETDRGEEE
jgi:hypothetical protein